MIQCVPFLLLPLLFTAPASAPTAPAEVELYVNPDKGKDSAPGTKRRPKRTLSAALATLPEPLEESVTVHLLSGVHGSTGGVRTSERSMQLAHRMRPGVTISIDGPKSGDPAVLDWRGGHLFDIREGEWQLRRVQVGTFRKDQRRGVQVRGPARVLLEDVTFRQRSLSDAGIWAEDGGRIFLRGAIKLNEHLHEKAEEETFCGIVAVDHGIVEFRGGKGSSLEIGNGSLSVRTYGRIRLGCESARITSWTKSNNLAVNHSGRIELANTPTILRAHRQNNTPIGLEHDGHLLAEDTYVKIIGPNDSAIALQKASTFTCNDIELSGEFEYAMWASSGSMFCGRFLTDVSKLDARTGAQILVEAIKGEVKEVVVRSGGLVALPDRVVRSE